MEVKKEIALTFVYLIHSFIKIFMINVKKYITYIGILTNLIGYLVIVEFLVGRYLISYFIQIAIIVVFIKSSKIRFSQNISYWLGVMLLATTTVGVIGIALLNQSFI